MPIQILASVGKGGSNRHDDVATVQQLLNFVPPEHGGPDPKLAVDGKFGTNTASAIERFQKIGLGFQWPDGRIDPGGKTAVNLLQFAQSVPVSGSSTSNTAGPSAETDIRDRTAETTNVTPAFEFLPADGESANDRLARYEEELLADGPIGWKERPDVMREFLKSTFSNGATLWKIGGTTCAVFQGGCLIGCGAQDRRPSPHNPAITTWLHASWFSGPGWIPVAKLISGEEEIIRGDIAYWCGNDKLEAAKGWKAATNGHVGCMREGSGFHWSTAEGGGADGRCQLQDSKKDVSNSWTRPLRGVWRPNLMKATVLPAPNTGGHS